MQSEILFSEKQRFNQWWLLLIFFIVNGLVITGVIKQLLDPGVAGDKPTGVLELILALVFTLVLSFGIFLFKLETIIKKDGVYVKFFPIHRDYRHYSWHQINRAYVRKYNPIAEYGGWGLRGLGKNRALNVSGTYGLQLELEDNKKLLIGTRKPEELENVIRKMKK